MQLGDGITRGPKWHDALGAFSGAERSLALDLLGFKHQVVFSSFCARLIFEAPVEVRYLRYLAARAHNRAMAALCNEDRRLIGVAMVPLDEPELAHKEIVHAAEIGLGAIWIAADPPGGRSPGHPTLEPIWKTLAERRLPFILRVGGAAPRIPEEWMNDGHPDYVSARRAPRLSVKDLTMIHHAAQRFISVLVLDGYWTGIRTCAGV